MKQNPKGVGVFGPSLNLTGEPQPT